MLVATDKKQGSYEVFSPYVFGYGYGSLVT